MATQKQVPAARRNVKSAQAAAPAEENARMAWWAIRILRQNEVTPHEVRWRKMLDGLRAQLAEATDERRAARDDTMVLDRRRPECAGFCARDVARAAICARMAGG